MPFASTLLVVPGSRLADFAVALTDISMSPIDTRHFGQAPALDSIWCQSPASPDSCARTEESNPIAKTQTLETTSQRRINNLQKFCRGAAAKTEGFNRAYRMAVNL